MALRIVGNVNTKTLARRLAESRDLDPREVRRLCVAFDKARQRAGKKLLPKEELLREARKVLRERLYQQALISLKENRKASH